MSNFGSFSYFQTSLSLRVGQVLQKLPKFDINDLKLLFHCYILIPRKCPRKTPFKTQCPPLEFFDIPTVLKWHMAALFSIAQLLHGAWTVCTNLLSNDWNAEPKSKWGQIISEGTVSQAQVIWILLVALSLDKATKYHLPCNFEVYENLFIFIYICNLVLWIIIKL